MQPLQFIAQDGDFVLQRANLFLQCRDDSFRLLPCALLALTGALLALTAAFFSYIHQILPYQTRRNAGQALRLVFLFIAWHRCVRVRRV